MSEDNKFSLINFDGASDVLNNLINKVSGAVGWVVTHDTPKRIAQRTYIEEIQKMDIPPLEKAALISNAKKAIKDYKSQTRVLCIAAQNLRDDAKPQDIDDDWISEFMDKVRNISDEEFQLIWARILAGEANNPGSFSLRTLEKLKELSKEEAMCFMHIAESIVMNGIEPIILKSDELERGKGLQDIMVLSECGILTNSSFLSIKVSLGKNEEKILFYNNNLAVKATNLTDGDKDINFGVYQFTKCGKEILKAIEVSTSNAPILIGAEKLRNEYLNENIQIDVYNVRKIDFESQKVILTNHHFY